MPTTITAQNMLDQPSDVRQQSIRETQLSEKTPTAPHPELLTQCLLSKGRSYRIQWLPADLAAVGRRMKMRINGKWDEGWVIRDVWDTRPAHQVRKA